MFFTIFTTLTDSAGKRAVLTVPEGNGAGGGGPGPENSIAGCCRAYRRGPRQCRACRLRVVVARYSVQF